MDLSDILKQHQLWLDKAKTSLEKLTNADITLPLDVKQQRIEEIKARITDFTGQKYNAVQRFDAAIARQKEELSRLEAAVSTDKKLLQGVAVSADVSSAAAITQTPAKKAGTKKRTKNVRAKAPPKAT